MRRATGTPEIRVLNARVELHRDPLSAFNGFRALAGLSLRSVAWDSVLGRLRTPLGRASHDGGAAPRRGRKRRLVHRTEGPTRSMAWSDVAFSVTAKSRALEILLGPRMTARYLASDGRAGEWLIQVPRQPFGGDPRASPGHSMDRARRSGRCVPRQLSLRRRRLASSRRGPRRARWSAAQAPSLQASPFRPIRDTAARAAEGRDRQLPLDGTGTVTLAEHLEIHLEAKDGGPAPESPRRKDCRARAIATSLPRTRLATKNPSSCHRALRFRRATV